MTAKERDAIFQHWRSVILRETRDLGSLERVGARALQDREVHGDALLASLIRAEVAGRRADIERERRIADSAERESRQAARRSDEAAAQRSRPKALRGDDAARRTTPTDRPGPKPEVRPDRHVAPPEATIAGPQPGPKSRSVRPPPVPPPPDPAQVAFDRLGQTIKEPLGRGDDGQASAVYEQMRALQEESREVIPAAALQPFERRLAQLRTRLDEFRVRIAALVQQAVAASRRGDETAAAALMRRLAAIHVTYPNLIDEARLGEIRQAIVRASEEHDDGVTGRRLVERERAVSAEITRIAAAVHEFHRVVCEVPESSEEFRQAEATYLRTLQEVQAHDPEWLAGFVLELADSLAEWRIPSPAVGERIDRFLESVRLSMRRIYKEIGRIDTKREETGGP